MARTFKAGVLITGDSKGAVKAVNLTEKEVGKLNKTTKLSKTIHSDASKKIAAGFGSMSAAAAKWGVAAGLAGAAMTTALVKSGLQSVDALAKTSDKLGVATESLAKLRFAAQQTGIETKAFDTALQRFTRRLSDAAAGTGPAVSAFNALGLSAKDLVKLKPDEAFAKVADKMNLVENSSQKVSLAFKLFDAEGVGLVNTLALGSDGLAEMGEQAEAAGLALSRIDAAKVEAANDAMARVQSTVSGFSQQLAVQFAPILAAVSDRLFGIGKDSGGMAKAAEKAFDFMVDAIGFASDAVRGLHIVFKTLQLGVEAFVVAFLKSWDMLLSGISTVADLIPGVNINYEGSTFHQFANDMRDHMFMTQNEIAALLNAPLPSDGIEAFVGDVVDQYEHQAVAAIETQDVVQGAMLKTEEVTEALATTTTKVAKEVESGWDKAIEGTVNRIDEAFASAWKGAFDSFSDFGDALKDAFKNLLAEMAHMAITRPIVMNIAGAFASAGASAGASAASSMGGSVLGSVGGSLLSGGISGIGSSITGGIGGLLSNAYTAGGELMMSIGQATGNQAIFNAGLTKAGMGSTVAAQNAAGTYSVDWAGGLQTAGAGIAGGWLGNRFGTSISDKKANSSLGSAAGGAIGAYMAAGTSVGGPWGAAIGAFVGALVDVFGGSSAQMPNRGARTELDVSTGYRASTGRQPGSGSKFSQVNYDSVEAAADAFQMFAGMLGGSSGSFNIHQGDRKGVRLNGESFTSMADAVSAGFDDILAAAENLTPQLRDLIGGFNGTVDQTLQFSNAVIQLTEASGVNSATQAVEDYAAAQEAAGISVMQAYKYHTMVLGGLIQNLDGSAYAADELNQALIANKSAAYDMVLAIQSISAELGLVAESSTEHFKTSVMGPEQLRRHQFDTRNSWVEELRVATDAGDIHRLTGNINAMNRTIFDSYSPEQQGKTAEGFIAHTAGVDVIAQAKLRQAEQFLVDTQETINTQVQTMLEDTAVLFQKPVNDFGDWVQYLVDNGITVNVDAGEVVA